MNDALNKVATCNVASAINSIIGHHDVEIVNMEMVPGEYELVFPKDGFVAHTNHLVCERHLNMVTDKNRNLLLDTFNRLDRVEKLLREQGEADVSHLKKIQDDHVNYPQSICRHLA